jgi:hypothetical protein
MKWMRRLAGLILQMADPVAYFELVQAAYQSAADLTGEEVCCFRIGGRAVQLRFAGSALISKVMPALAHLSTNDGAEAPDLIVCLWDSASTGVDLPAKVWSADYEDVGGFGEVRGFNTDRIFTIEQQQRFHGVDTLELYDAQQSLGIFHCSDADQIPYWMESFPLRAIFHCWTASQETQITHGAALGMPEGGVLLAGRGGSGKSTSALACLGTSLRYAGDDYVMVCLAPQPYVYSLYNTAKIAADNLFRLPHLKARIANADHLGDEKALVFLHQHHLHDLITGFPLKAIVHPKITRQPDSRLTPTTPMKLLAELAPTTTFQLRGARQRTFDRLAQLVRQVPGYTLELGTDLSQIPDLLMSLI